MNDNRDTREAQEDPPPATYDNLSGRDDRAPEPDSARDQELLALIEAAITNRRELRADGGLGAAAEGATGSIATFSAHLAATLPRVDERFQDDLLALLLQELSEPEAAQEPARQSASEAGVALAQTGAKPSKSLVGSETRLIPFRILQSAFPIPKRGWMASAATALAGVAVLVLVVVGMLGVIRLGQQSSHPTKNVQDSLQLVRSLQPFVTLKSGPAAYIAWSPDGSRLATAEITNAEWPGGVIGNNWPTQTLSLKLRDVHSGRLLRDMTLQNIKSLAWSPDGSVLAVGLDRNTIILLERDGGERFTLATPFVDQMKPVNMGWGWFNQDAGWERLAWSPDGRTLAATSGEPYTTDQPTREGVLRLWDPATGKLMRSIKVPDETSSKDRQAEGNTVVPADPYAIGWSPDGGTIAANVGQALLLWKAATGELQQTIRVSKETDVSYRLVGKFAWSPDGRTLAISEGRYVELWNPATGTYERSMPETLPPSPVPTGPPQTPLPEKSYLATFEADQVGNQYSPLQFTSWSPDGTRISTYDGIALRVWDVAAGVRLHSIGTTVSTIAWSPDGQLITSTDGDVSQVGQGAGGSIIFWDARSGAQVRTIADGQAYNFAWSPDGSLLAVSSQAGIVLWGAASASATPSASPFSPVATAKPSVSPLTNSACGIWTIADSPNVDSSNGLNAVAASAPDDVWAVGSKSKALVKDDQDLLNKVYPDQALILHWDGKAWAEVPSPNVGTGDNALGGVAVASRTEAWAVGYYDSGREKDKDGRWMPVSPNHSLILHWDGTAWNAVPGPDVEGLDNRLKAVAAISGNDVWAVGYYGGTYSWEDPSAPISRTLIVHWDGKAWSRVPSPDPGQYGNQLAGVAATASDDVWAVGTLNPHESKPMGGVDANPLILHWNGSDWSQSPAPTGMNVITGVAAASRDAAWVIGEEASECCGDARILRWDGTRWSPEPIPSTKIPADAQPGSYLAAISALSPNDVWVVGNYVNDSDGGSYKNKTLAMHWDGARWSIVPSPNRETVGSNENLPSFKQQVSQINGLAAISSHDVWAAGYSDVIDSQTLTMIMHYSDAVCLPTPSVTAAAPSGTITPISSAESTQTATVPTKATSKSPTPLPLSSVPECGLTWSLVPLPSSTATSGTNAGPFTGIAAVSSNDIWAVGYGSTSPANTLTAHWDGSAWSIVASPNEGTGDNKLYGVAAAGPNDVWAVGSYGTASTESKPLIIHWDGSAWKVVPAADPGPGAAVLRAVAIVSPNDVWAVGSYSFNSNPGNTDPAADVWKARTLIEHWDGRQWSIMSGPSPGNLNNALSALAVVSKNDIWAVGYYAQQQDYPPPTKILILHWDGGSWTQVSSPDVQTSIDGLSGVAARSADDVWAVGWANNGEHVDPLTMHWDGKQWSIVPSPASTSHDGGSLSTVAALSANDVWAVGGDYGPTAMHWNGSSWEGFRVYGPGANGKTYVGWLAGIAAVSPTDMWPAGGLQDVTVSGNLPGPLVMHYGDVPCTTPSPAIPTSISTTSLSPPTTPVTEPPAKGATEVPTSGAGGITGNTTLSAVSFIDANRGWLADGSTILSTNDGGQRWIKRWEAPGEVSSLDFVSELKGWLTAGGRLYDTLDGGSSWQLQYSPGNAKVYQVDFTDASSGWLTSILNDGNGTHSIQHTADNGASWAVVTDPCGQGWGPGQFSFIGPSTGFIMCGHVPGAGHQAKQLFETTDGGQSWKVVASDDEFGGTQAPGGGRLSGAGYLVDSFFLDTLHGWYSKNLTINGQIEATTDGGISWYSVHITDAQGIPYKMRFITPGVGFTLFDSRGGVESGTQHRVLLGTRDGGASWKQLYPAVAPVGPVQYLDAGAGFGAATALDWGAILKTTDGGTSWAQVGAIPDLCGFSKLSSSQCEGGCQALISALDFSDARHGFATAKCYAVSNPPDMRYETTDGGATWSVVPNK